MITKKQLEEIDFLCKQWDLTPTQKEKEEYIEMTVKGTKETGGQRGANPIFQAKRRLDITIKNWSPELKDGLLTIQELKEDFNHPYMDKVLKGIAKGMGLWVEENKEDRQLPKRKPDFKFPFKDLQVEIWQRKDHWVANYKLEDKENEVIFAHRGKYDDSWEEEIRFSFEDAIKKHNSTR